jgi:hypothetical protein
VSLLLKWNVKFNTKKSKVLVIGDRLNTENGWELEKDRSDVEGRGNVFIEHYKEK